MLSFFVISLIVVTRWLFFKEVILGTEMFLFGSTCFIVRG